MNCPACQRDNPADSNFCNQCGARMGAPTPAEREPRDYTPAHLAQKILTTRFALEGERKPVTVLFVDLEGSVELSAGRDPEEWHQVMDQFFERLTHGVHRFEGTVNQYTGDGVMALFGAPIAHEDHAQRACHAALFLRDELRRFSQALRREHGLDFDVRMGMNSGDVVVGRIGDDLRMDYTAQGAVVGLAARMQQLAEPGRIYLTEHTAALVPGYFEFEVLGGFNIRGIPAPVTVQALEGVGPLQTRLDLARARGLSPFVGREAELAVLESELEHAILRAAEGHPGAELQARNCSLALAELMLDPANALRWGRRSLEVADRIGLGEWLAEIGHERGLAGLARSTDAPRAAVERDLDRAEALARAGHAASRLPFVAHTRAECERRRGNRVAQQASLEAERDALDEMGATRLRSEIDRELAALAAGDPF